MEESLLEELREVRFKLREVEGVLVTPEALKVLGRTGTSPANLADRYRSDCLRTGWNGLIGYRLSDEARPDPETCVHAALDPDLGRVVIYEEW